MILFTPIRTYERRPSTDTILSKHGSGEMAVCDGLLNDQGMREKIVAA